MLVNYFLLLFLGPRSFLLEGKRHVVEMDFCIESSDASQNKLEDATKTEINNSTLNVINTDKSACLNPQKSPPNKKSKKRRRKASSSESDGDVDFGTDDVKHQTKVDESKPIHIFSVVDNSIADNSIGDNSITIDSSD